MPQLRVDVAPAVMNSFGHLLPSLDLLGVPYPRRVFPLCAMSAGAQVKMMSTIIAQKLGAKHLQLRKSYYLPLASDENTFSDDEADAAFRALLIVCCHEIDGDRVRRSVSRHCRHLDPVGDGDISNFDRGEE